MFAPPSAARSRWALPLLKVSGGGRATVALVGERFWYFGSHWLDRMYLCAGDGCPGCMHGPPRTMGYRVVMVQHPTRWNPALLEASCLSINQLEGLAAMESLQVEAGLIVDVSRKTKRSPVRLEPASSQASVQVKAQKPFIALNAVALLFGLPLMSEVEEPADWAERSREVAAGRLAAALLTHARS